ncbi:MAG: hypothetical protein OXT65_02445 [Alphaproteobacteria bacterium]|nr:hypothetical protein [Alphaproteobacteria bacterium]
MNTETENKKACETIATIYGFFALSTLLSFIPFPQTMLLGTAGYLIAIAAAYIYKNKYTEPPYDTHFRWVIRTFWIGTGIYLPIMMVLMTVMVMSSVNYGVIYLSMQSGAPLDLERMTADLIRSNAAVFVEAALILFAYVCWWWYRCIKGYLALRKNKPIENVTTWF